MKIKDEIGIALGLILVAYILATLVKTVFFFEQSLIWHISTSLMVLFAMAFLAMVIKFIDNYLDTFYPFEKNVLLRIIIQFALTLTVVIGLRIGLGVIVLRFFPFRVTNEMFFTAFVLNTFMVLSITLSFFGYHFFKLWKEERITAAQLEAEKAQVQYDNLKNQLNPHFLFNSLTSLHSLIYENPNLAADFLQQLAKVYRYVLNNKEKNKVPISTEVEFVNQYVQLLKTRFEEGLEVSFQLDENVSNKGIAPVTLQILIENAIKHNTTHKSAPLHIAIYNDETTLYIKNNIQTKISIDSSNGQGLENLQNLYRYLSETPIVVTKDTQYFLVKLPLLSI